MATSEHPITRSELREELRHYATKEDVANLKWQLAVFFVALVSVLLGFWNLGGKERHHASRPYRSLDGTVRLCADC